jgi:type II restriction/modification system DNA methylase subunit YeeA
MALLSICNRLKNIKMTDKFKNNQQKSKDKEIKNIGFMLSNIKMIETLPRVNKYNIKKRPYQLTIDTVSFFVLSLEDSNFFKQNQKLLCYHYTKGQAHRLSSISATKVEISR